MGSAFSVFIALVMIGALLMVLRDNRRIKRRKQSLRQRDNGTWVWVDFDGQERSSATRPDQPGGLWDRENADASDGGGFGGGDGGDGGGGGD